MENRKKLPKDVSPPLIPNLKPTTHTRDVTSLVEKKFKNHTGLSKEFWLPTTRAQAQHWLDIFLKERFFYFGHYEDALTTESEFVYHSGLSAILNVGLITPGEMLEKAIKFGKAHEILIQSLEGFVRQVLGWREFIRGIYQNFGKQQQSMNFWNHHKKLSSLWYEAKTTGIPILDHVLLKVSKRGYLHHIERLMVVGNLMVLLEIHPHEAYKWFMEMFVDSSDWVMVPNVYGMALFADGGLFATKPYICGSNYFIKMSGISKGPWCDGIDGLYWSFIEKHKSFFMKNPRTSLAVALLEKIPKEKLIFLQSKAQEIKEKLTLN